MLIFCSGPDTFRAQAKAQELEEAFRKKYDANGLSVEHLSSGKEAVTDIVERGSTMSLFASRRFLRTRNLLTESTKATRQLLAKALAYDQESVIVLSVEDDPPLATTLKELGTEIKIIKYDFPLLQGAAFLQWADQVATILGITDRQKARALAQACEGDAWQTWNELMKLAANPECELLQEERVAQTIFAYAEAYLKGRSSWRTLLDDKDLSVQALNVFLSQARAALRVRDGVTEGLHPFLVKKMRGVTLPHLEQSFAFLLQAVFAQRAGYMTDQESPVLF